MVQVLILEDDQVSMEALKRILQEYSDEFCIHMASSYQEAKDLLNTDVRYGLFLLDVNLSGDDKEDIGGLVFAKEIRDRFYYTFTPIVMITAIGAMEMRAYREIHCYQYIMKPFERKQVEEVLTKVLEKEKNEKPQTLNVKKDGINYQIQCDEIQYIEAVPRGCALHMKKETWKVPYVTLTQMLKKIPDEMFVQCHRMFAVNVNEVEYYDKVNRIVKIKNCQDVVEIGVTYKAEVGRLIQ